MASGASALNVVAFAALCVMLVLSSLGDELPSALRCCSNSCASYCNSSCAAAANQSCDIQLPIRWDQCYYDMNSSCTANCGTNCGSNATCIASCRCDELSKYWCAGVNRFSTGCNMYNPRTIFQWCWPTCNATCYGNCIKG